MKSELFACKRWNSSAAFEIEAFLEALPNQPGSTPLEAYQNERRSSLRQAWLTFELEAVHQLGLSHQLPLIELVLAEILMMVAAVLVLSLHLSLVWDRIVWVDQICRQIELVPLSYERPLQTGNGDQLERAVREGLIIRRSAVAYLNHLLYQSEYRRMQASARAPLCASGLAIANTMLLCYATTLLIEYDSLVATLYMLLILYLSGFSLVGSGAILVPINGRVVKSIDRLIARTDRVLISDRSGLSQSVQSQLMVFKRLWSKQLPTREELTKLYALDIWLVQITPGTLVKTVFYMIALALLILRIS